MPLAVKRYQVSDLPVSLELSDQDAMLAEMKLSSFQQVVVQARISKTGSPTEGEWQSLASPQTLPVTTELELVIDQAIVK